jgi:RecB family exonuclease
MIGIHQNSDRENVRILSHRRIRQAEFRPALTEKTRPGQVCLEKKAPLTGRWGGEDPLFGHQIAQEKL